MEFAPKGLKVGDIFEDCYGNKLKVTQVFDFGYNAQPVESEPEQIDLADLPFADDGEAEEKPKRRRTSSRKKANE